MSDYKRALELAAEVDNAVGYVVKYQVDGLVAKNISQALLAAEEALKEAEYALGACEERHEGRARLAKEWLAKRKEMVGNDSTR